MVRSIGIPSHACPRPDSVPQKAHIAHIAHLAYRAHLAHMAHTAHPHIPRRVVDATSVPRREAARREVGSLSQVSTGTGERSAVQAGVPGCRFAAGRAGCCRRAS
eukprot:689678-Rhodomonas_salina.1